MAKLPPRFAPTGNRANVTGTAPPPATAGPPPPAGFRVVGGPTLTPSGSGAHLGLTGGQPAVPQGYRNVSPTLSPTGGLNLAGLTPKQVVDFTHLTQFDSNQAFNELVSGKYTKDQVAVLAEIAGRYNRPHQTLGVIGRVLNVGVNVSTALGTGVARVVKDATHFKGGSTWQDIRDVLEITPPWWVASVVAHGYVDVPKAIYENKTYDDLIKEQWDPKSFMYRHAMPIGLAADIAFDPTTYVTFGVTAPSKVAARELMMTSMAASHDAAMTAIKTGVYKGEQIPAGMDINTLMPMIHMIERRPFTPGDAMAQIRQTDQARLGILRASGEAYGKIDVLKAGARSVAPRGGFGIRMAGTQLVPPSATDALAANIRKVTGRKPSTFTSARSGAPTEGFTKISDFKDFPLEKFSKVHEDILRTSAMVEFKQVGMDQITSAMKRVEETKMLFKMPKEAPLAATTADQAILARAKTAIEKIFVNTTPEYVPPGYRVNLLKPDYKFDNVNPYRSRLQQVRESAFKERDATIATAVDHGFRDSAIQSMRDQWDFLVEKYSDPVDVLSRFQANVEGRILSDQGIDQILKNPMHARIPNPHYEALMQSQDDLDRAVERWTNVQGKLNAAKKTKKPKSTITKFANQLEAARVEKTAARLRYEEVKVSHAAEKTGARVVDHAGQLGQDALPITHKGQKYFVTQAVSEAMEAMRNPKYIDAEVQRRLDRLNWAQHKWKMLATTANMSFHVMNLVGGMWNNMLGGVWNPRDYVTAWGDVIQKHNAEADKITFAGKIVGRFRPMQEAKTGAERQNALITTGASGGQVHEVTGEQAYGARATGDPKNRYIPRDVRFAARRLRQIYGVSSIGAAVLPDQWVPDDVQDVLNPALGGALLLPEITKIGRRTASDVEDILRTTPMIAAERNPTYRQLLSANSIPPPINFGKHMGSEGPLDLPKIERERAWNIGARNALHYQFDYSDLSNFEKMFAKSVFPFYTFYKNNFILQAREIVNRPRFVNTFQDITGYMNTLGDDEQNPWFKKLLPEYFDKLNMFKMPVPNLVRDKLGIPHGQDVYLNPKLPFASLNLFPPLWQLAEDNSISPTSQKWGAVLSPVFGAVGPFAGGGPFKPLLEAYVGYNLGLARPIDFQRIESQNYRQSAIAAPGWMQFIPDFMKKQWVWKDPDTGQEMMHPTLKYVVDQMASPFISSFGDALGATGDSGTAQQKAGAFSWITGVRLTPVDPIKLQRGWLYRMQSYLQGQKADAKQRGITFSPEDELLLRRIRAQIKPVNYAYEQEQKAIHGQ